MVVLQLAARSELAAARSLNYTRDLVGSPVDVVVHDDRVSEAPAPLHLVSGELEARRDVGLGVAPLAQPLGLGLFRGRDEEHRDDVVSPLEDLLGALHVDLQDQVVGGWDVGRRCAVELAEDLGVLQEAAGLDAFLEGRPVDEGVGVL